VRRETDGDDGRTELQLRGQSAFSGVRLHPGVPHALLRHPRRRNKKAAAGFAGGGLIEGRYCGFSS